MTPLCLLPVPLVVLAVCVICTSRCSAQDAALAEFHELGVDVEFESVSDLNRFLAREVNVESSAIAQGISFPYGWQEDEDSLDRIHEFVSAYQNKLSVGFVGPTNALCVKIEKSVTDAEHIFRQAPAVFLGVGMLPESNEVIHVVSGSTAEVAGIKQGDKIVRLGQTDVSDIRSLRVSMLKYIPGERVGLTYKRGDLHDEITLEFKPDAISSINVLNGRPGTQTTSQNQPDAGVP